MFKKELPLKSPTPKDAWMTTVSNGRKICYGGEATIPDISNEEIKCKLNQIISTHKYELSDEVLLTEKESDVEILYDDLVRIEKELGVRIYYNKEDLNHIIFSSKEITLKINVRNKSNYTPTPRTDFILGVVSIYHTQTWLLLKKIFGKAEESEKNDGFIKRIINKGHYDEVFNI